MLFEAFALVSMSEDGQETKNILSSSVFGTKENIFSKISRFLLIVKYIILKHLYIIYTNTIRGEGRWYRLWDGGNGMNRGVK